MHIDLHIVSQIPTKSREFRAAVKEELHLKKQKKTDWLTDCMTDQSKTLYSSQLRYLIYTK